MSEFITLFLVILAATAFLIFHIETTAPWKREHPYFGIIEYQHGTKGDSIWQGYLNLEPPIGKTFITIPAISNKELPGETYIAFCEEIKKTQDELVEAMLPFLKDAYFQVFQKNSPENLWQEFSHCSLRVPFNGDKMNDWEVFFVVTNLDVLSVKISFRLGRIEGIEIV